MINEYWILAFVVTPAVVVCLGRLAAYLHLRSLRRE